MAGKGDKDHTLNYKKFWTNYASLSGEYQTVGKVVKTKKGKTTYKYK